MRTHIESTSSIALENFKKEGKREKHHRLILNALKGRTLTAHSIAVWSGLNTVQVSRRTSELERLNKIERVCKMRDADGSLRNAYRVLVT